MAATPRLSLALAGTGLWSAAGTILVSGARAGCDLSALPTERMLIVQGFRPDHDALAAKGYSVTPDIDAVPGGAAAGVVFLPRARGAARHAVASVMRRVVPGGAIWIDGQKTDGIDTMLKDVRARTAVSQPLAKSHGKIFRVDRPDDDSFADWIAPDLVPAPGFVTRPGVFSADAVDRGSALLAEALPARLGRIVADFGGGWGWLAAQILTRDGVETLDLIEADHLALTCARRNISDPRAVFHWADVTQYRPEALYDAIVTNPPFHTGRAAEPALGLAFIAAAAARLKPSGTLWLVANRHLPYEAALSERFRDVVEIGSDRGFKLFSASRPVGAPRPKR
jgi:16S rRNA (guanine1207-N2)-methyltransferase